jgi:curved DNA-binding protein CbpA
MAEITINFDSLKFNLYEILNVTPESSESKIKKAFRNLILHFHPDKNNNTEEDIYQHIILANQILTNKESKKKYDDFLIKSEQTHCELKNYFKKNKNENESFTKKDIEINEKEAKINFENKLTELSNKHISNFNEKDTIKNYEKLLKDRKNELDIPKESFTNMDEFNNKFESKITNKIFGDQIIPIQEDMKLSTFNVNDNYTSLDIAFDNLYIDGGGISTSKYTSLEAAFKIQSLDLSKKEINIEEAIKTYKKETENFNNPNIKYDTNNMKYDTNIFNHW